MTSIKNYNPNKKIKRFRGLEKLIYTGLIAGLGLTVGGKIKKSVKYQGIGGGLIVASFIGNNYLENKRNLEFKEYIKEKKNN